MTKSHDASANQIKLTYDRPEGDRGVFLGEDGMEILIPKKHLPKGCKEGDALFLTLITAENETKRREKKAKEILNEIMGGFEKRW